MEADSSTEELNESKSQEFPVTSTQLEEDTEPIENYDNEIPVPQLELNQPRKNKLKSTNQLKRKNGEKRRSVPLQNTWCPL